MWLKYPGGVNGEIGEQVNTTYTSQGLLRQVQSNGGVYYVGDTLYNVRGQVSERRLGSTVGVIKQLYDYAASENFRLTAFRSGITPNYNTLQNVTYSYDDAGNVLSIIDAAAYNGPPPTPPATQTQSFSYDALNRLTTAAATGGSYGTYTQRSYQYSNAGNLTSFEGSVYAYNDAAHKHGVTHVSGVQKYWYDPNGNVTQRTSPWSTTIALAYNAENRLTDVTGAATETHTYDGDGNRVKAVVNGTTSIYVGNYYEVTGGVVKKYYYAGSARVAESNGGTLYFLLSDHLGSTATTTDANGVRATELRYYPYGDARYNPGSQITTFRFTGQRWDPGSGLYFYNARWYDPLIGRFLQADTIVPQPGNPQALNRYSYVLNSPLRFNDPSGHWRNVPSVNGSIGSTGVASGNTLGIASPALQPLTVGTSFGQKDVTIGAAPPGTFRPDDGVLLMYANPGELRPRSEVVGYAAGLPDNPFVGFGFEERRVTTYESFFDWSVRRTYVETAINGSIGLIGAEWTGSKGADPAISVGPVELQPGQLMVGLTNPTGGAGGVRGGVQYQLSSNSFLVTTRGDLNEIGGVHIFGQRYKPDSKLIREVYVSGQRTRWGWMSGYDRLRWQLWGARLEAEEVP